MATGGAKRRFSSVALALLAALIVGGIAAPIIVSFGSNRITVGSSSLVAAPRDSVLISSPTPLGTSRIAWIDRGLLYPVDAAGRALDKPLNPNQLAGGGTRFLLENGTLRIQAGAAEPNAELISPLVEAVGALQFEAVVLRNVTIQVQLPDGRIETVTDIDGEITHKRRASLMVKGKGDLRGQRIAFDATSGVVPDARPGTLVPLKVTLKSGMMEAAFDGRVGFVGPAQMQGSVDFSVPHVRQFARWFGGPWPAGNGLRNLTAQGQLVWTGPAMAFNKGTFRIDGNEATGTLHLNFVHERPSIGGTLALKTLDLGRYFPAPTATIIAPPSTAWSALNGTDLTLPLAPHFDVDLRISADKVKLGTWQLGRSAAAVTVTQGRMLADVAAFEFDGGRGSGQITADMSASTPKVGIRGRLDDLDGARMSAAMFGHPVVAGRATFTVDVASRGRTGGDLLTTSQGKIHLGLRSGGRLGVDLRGLAAAASKRPVDGWGAPGRGSTSFETLDAAFGVRSGALVASEVKIVNGDTATTVGGMIDLPTNRLNVTLDDSPAAGPARAGASPTLSINGPWHAPTLRRDNHHDRAADPLQQTSGSPARL